jgi:hypothetical protein
LLESYERPVGGAVPRKSAWAAGTSLDAQCRPRLLEVPELLPGELVEPPCLLPDVPV